MTTQWVNFFGGLKSSRPPGAGVAPRPNIGAENWNFLKLLKTMIVGFYGFVWVTCALGYFVFYFKFRKKTVFFCKLQIENYRKNNQKSKSSNNH